MIAALLLAATVAINQPVQANAQALVYAAFPQASGAPAVRGAAAILTLAAKPNKDWYANWLMIAGFASNGTGPNFVQIGLIRFPDQGNKLHAFIAHVQWPRVRMMTANPMPPPVVYQDLGAVSEGNHSVAISWSQGEFSFTLDNAALGDKVTIDIAKPVVQAGAEARHPGDALSGSVSGLIVSNGVVSAPVLPQESHCIVEQFGGVLTADPGAGFVASGKMDPRSPGTFSGDCASVIPRP